MAFHVPEVYREMLPGMEPAVGNNGFFAVQAPITGRILVIVASDGGGFDHVSVHVRNRQNTRSFMPTWAEMSFVKDLFWDPEDAVMQIHPPKSTYVNCHPMTLHLWRPTNGQTIPLPDPETVGPAGKSPGVT